MTGDGCGFGCADGSDQILLFRSLHFRLDIIRTGIKSFFTLLLCTVDTMYSLFKSENIQHLKCIKVALYNVILRRKVVAQITHYVWINSKATELTGVGAADRLLLHRGTCTRAVRRVRALIRRSFEKIVLQSVVGRDARLWVVVEHAQNQVLELEIVGE